MLLLTHPWQGSLNLVGIAAALGAAICWAAYIMLTQAVGDEVAGLQGLAVSIPVAALATTLVSGPTVIADLTPHLLLAGFGLALLLPVIPFSLEMYALRRLTTSAFGTLMCLEPAIALVAGLALLGQVPRAWSLAGVAFVIAAGLGAERSGARPDETHVRIRSERVGVAATYRGAIEEITGNRPRTRRTGSPATSRCSPGGTGSSADRNEDRPVVSSAACPYAAGGVTDVEGGPGRG